MTSAKTLRRWCSVVVLALAACLPPWVPASFAHADAAASGASSQQRLLIVCADESVREKADMIANLAGHFRLRADTADLAALQQTRLSAADFVIFISSKAQGVREQADERFARANRPTLWIGEPDGERDADAVSAIRYTYRGQTFTERSSPVFRLPAGVRPDRTLAEASDGDVTVPLLAAAGNRWYFASQQFFGTPGHILADGLHDFFGQAHAEVHEGFIRIEDVHPYVDPDKLKQIADLLYARHIPYMVAVIPVYVNPQTGERVQMGERPAFIKALTYMAEHGASFIMHGYTHQYRSSETGEGFEFWDSVQDAPIENEAAYTADKLERGLATMVYNGIDPVAFEPPHYTMSQSGYAVLSRYFTTLVAQLQVSDRTYQLTQRPPYRLDSERHGLHVIPETIGYVQNEPGYPELMRPKIEQTFLVRDSVVGGFYHPYLPIDKLQKLIDIMDEYPLQYIDLKTEENGVHSDFVDIESGAAGIRLTVKDPAKLTLLGASPKAEERRSWLSDMTYAVTWGIAIVVLGFLFLFVVLLLRLNRKRRAALFIERKADGL